MKYILYAFFYFIIFTSSISILGILWMFVDLIRYNIAVLRGKKPHTKFWEDLDIK